MRGLFFCTGEENKKRGVLSPIPSSRHRSDTYIQIPILSVVYHESPTTTVCELSKDAIVQLQCWVALVKWCRGGVEFLFDQVPLAI